MQGWAIFLAIATVFFAIFSQYLQEIQFLEQEVNLFRKILGNLLT